MVDLAKKAFSTNNFDLAADIFQRTIKENGPKVELFLGLADSFAHGGRFSEAFEAYSHAFLLGSVIPEKLKHLATALVNCVKKQSTPKPAVMNKKCMFTCVLCRGLFNDPVTIPCGHSFCRKCLLKDKSKVCQKCGVVHYRLKVEKLKPNVLMCQMIEKWFEKEYRVSKLKGQGNAYFQRGDYENAITLYCKAIDLVEDDHLVLSNRSHAYACLDKFKFALKDAERVIELRPDWPKGYYRKGVALAGLGEYESSVVAYLQCLALDPSVVSVKEELTKVLHKILLPLPPEDPKSAQLQKRLHPSKLQQLIQDNFTLPSLLLPGVNVGDLQNLESIISAVTTLSAGIPDDSEMDENGSDSENIRNIDGATVSSCRSAPTSRESSPVRSLPLERSRSHSPLPFASMLTCSRKRPRHPSANSPDSPNRSSPIKCFKAAYAAAATTADVRSIDASLLNAHDFECSLCFRMLYEPVTTPCGHTFCRECLDRSLDHQTVCPLCKGSLTEYLAERRQAVTESVQTIMEIYFTNEYKERKCAHEEEMAELARMDKEHEIPIFVCTLAFPTMPCPLHIFEPRYRLMLRQCMESGTRQFGMVISSGENEDEFCSIGTMLEIRDVQFFPDGRALVDTTGGQRFKVLSRGRRDGYNTAKVEFFGDTKVSDAELPALKELETQVYDSCLDWLSNLPEHYKDQIQHHFGQFPEREADVQASPSGPTWVWWAVAVLPLDRQVRMLMLAMRSFRERLVAIRRMVSYLNRKKQQNM